MKLKTLPAPCDVPTAVPRSTEQVLAKVRTPPPTLAVEPAAKPVPTDPFTACVRRLTHGRDLATETADCSANTVTGAIIAETKVDGVRYVMLRCAPKPNEAFLCLSPRERDIVNLITKGYPNKAIAELLDISAWTVGTHLRRIFAKLGVTSRAAMVARYLHHAGDQPLLPVLKRELVRI